MNRTYSSAHRRSFFYSGLILFLFLLGLRSISSAAIWYVAPLGSGGNDSNPGTLAQPFYTLWPAVTSAQPGDTIYARGGTYHYSVGQWLQCSGTASSWITIAAYPGENPVIDGSSMPASQYGLGIGGQGPGDEHAPGFAGGESVHGPGRQVLGLHQGQGFVGLGLHGHIHLLMAEQA